MAVNFRLQIHHLSIMPLFIKSISIIIILLGLLHISYSYPFQANEDTLWFVGSGLTVCFAGLLNLVAIHKGGSLFTKTIAALVNAIVCAMFCFALSILNDSILYAGIIISFIAFVVFILSLIKPNLLSNENV